MQTVTRNGRAFPRYLTSPVPTGGYRIADLATDTYSVTVYPNKRTALLAARELNAQVTA